MATAENVIDCIVEQTQLGHMTWPGCGWGGDGRVDSWLGSWYDCQFAAEMADGGPRIRVYSPGIEGAVTIAEGEVVVSLIRLLRDKYSKEKTTRDEALAYAYDRLTNYPRRP